MVDYGVAHHLARPALRSGRISSLQPIVKSLARRKGGPVSANACFSALGHSEAVEAGSASLPHCGNRLLKMQF